jgi:hypothetical protein
MFKNKGQGDIRNGSIDECLFTIYTNADVDVQLKCDKSTEFDQEEFLNTGGYVLKFTEETCKDIYKHVKEKSRYREFLSRYRIIYKEANERILEVFIIPQMQEKLELPESERESTCQYFCDFTVSWWQKKNYSYFLQETKK